MSKYLGIVPCEGMISVMRDLVEVLNPAIYSPTIKRSVNMRLLCSQHEILAPSSPVLIK